MDGSPDPVPQSLVEPGTSSGDPGNPSRGPGSMLVRPVLLGQPCAEPREVSAGVRGCAGCAGFY